MRFIRLPRLAVLLVVLPAFPPATPSWAGTSFTVVAVDSGPAPQLPYVQRVYTEPAHPTSRETTSVVLEGVFPYPCWQVIHRSNMPISLELDRKSTRLNSSHVKISYAVFCLKKKNHQVMINLTVATT